MADQKGWKYKTTASSTLSEEDLNPLGNEGWELVAVVPFDITRDHAGYRVVFKREK